MSTQGLNIWVKMCVRVCGGGGGGRGESAVVSSARNNGEGRSGTNTPI